MKESASIAQRDDFGGNEAAANEALEAKKGLLHSEGFLFDQKAHDESTGKNIDAAELRSPSLRRVIRAETDSSDDVLGTLNDGTADDDAARWLRDNDTGK